MISDLRSIAKASPKATRPNLEESTSIRFLFALPDMLEDKGTVLCWDDVSSQISNPV